MSTTSVEQHEELKPSSLGELSKLAKATVRAPSGGVYTVQPLIMEHHIKAGNMPGQLLAAVVSGDDAIEKFLSAGETKDGEKPTDEQLRQREEELNDEARRAADYIDDLICQTVLAPKITPEDLRARKVPEVDYKWLSRIALRKEGGDVDGEGKEIFGRPPLDRFQLFRVFHSCDADCEACEALLDAFSQPAARRSA